MKYPSRFVASIFIITLTATVLGMPHGAQSMDNFKASLEATARGASHVLAYQMLFLREYKHYLQHASHDEHGMPYNAITRQRKLQATNEVIGKLSAEFGINQLIQGAV